MIITSKQNKIIKFAKQLQTKKFVELFGKCFLETSKIIKDVDYKDIDTLLIAEQSLEKYKEVTKSIDKTKIYVISESVCKYLSQTNSGSDIFAIYTLQKNLFNKNKNTVILDGIQDPSNLGAIIRSCLAFDFCNIIAIDSVFPYTNKVIRASMGYIFKVNFIAMKKQEFINWKNSLQIKAFVASMEGENLSTFKKPSDAFAIIIGNEGDGVSKELLSLCDGTITVPMQNKVESLNAAVCAAIIMHELSK